MPVQFNQLSALANPHLFTQQELPMSAPSGGGDDFSSILGGLAKLIGGNKPTTSTPTAPQTNSSPSASNAPIQGSVNPYVPQGMINPPRMSNSPLAQMAMNGRSPIMTVVDYSIPSNQPRMWVVDTQKNQVLMNTYVAHGSGSGKGINATTFSNEPNSHASSLGTFITDQEYQGKHGDSLRVKGLEKGINDNAFARSVVIHGGNYVGQDKAGNSWGCFAVPDGDAPKLIGLTKGGTIIHAYAPDRDAFNNFGRSLTPHGQTSLSQQMQPIPDAHPELLHTLNGIAHVETGSETSDPYTVTGKPTRSGDRAYGKYQIMGSNIPSWSKAATGTPLTPQQFLHDPAAQEKVAAYTINQYLRQGYSPQDAASLWFTGRPLNKVRGSVKDSYGTSNSQYQKKFNQGYLQSKRFRLSMNDIDETGQNGRPYYQHPTNNPNEAVFRSLNSNTPIIPSNYNTSRMPIINGNNIQDNQVNRRLVYNSIHPDQIKADTSGQQPPKIPPNILEQIIRQIDQGKSYEG